MIKLQTLSILTSQKLHDAKKLAHFLDPKWMKHKDIERVYGLEEMEAEDGENPSPKIL